MAIIYMKVKVIIITTTTTTTIIPVGTVALLCHFSSRIYLKLNIITGIIIDEIRDVLVLEYDTLPMNDSQSLKLKHLEELPPMPPLENDIVAAWYDTDLWRFVES